MVNDETLKLRDAVESYVDSKYGSKPEHLWKEYPEYEVFRHESKGKEKGKWFLLLANVTRKQLNMDDPTGETIFVANVKCEPDRVLELLHEPGYARAYHMNKEQWLSILLDGTVSMEKIKALIDNSFILTE